MGLSNILTRVFGEPEEMNGRNRCPTYLYRWFIAKTNRFNVYLHHFVGNDWSKDLHDHPKRFISIGLWGWYIEETPHMIGYFDGNFEKDWIDFKNPDRKRFTAPWIRTFSASHIHRLVVPSKNCWTLVITLKAVRPWGFWHLGRFIPWKHYVDGVDRKIADEMKDC